MTQAEPIRILGLVDGPMPPSSAMENCAGLGIELLPYVECMPLGPTPCLMAGPVNQWRLNLGLSAGFSGFVELSGMQTSPDVWAACATAVAAGGIAVSLTSASAYGHDIPAPFIAAIARLFPNAACIAALELALYEALANAIIHGNLGIDSSLRGSAEDLRAYRAALAHALSDPARSARRVTICCYPQGDLLRLSVRDQGDGWDVTSRLHGPARAEAKSGRGLDLIRQTAKAIHAEDRGRHLIMDFHRHPA